MTEVKNEFTQICCDPFKIHKKKVTALICVINQKGVSKLMSGVPVPEATTHVMSLPFSSSYEEVLSVQLALHLAFA